ncbi:MAG: hypothetical protein AAGB51_06535 [Planctomycetota bacterium]
MSAIGGLGGAAFNPLQFQGFGAGTRPQPTAQQRAQIEEAATAAGIDPAQFETLRADIQSAVEGVFSGGTDDPRADIEAAINSVFEENGIDRDAFQSQVEGLFTQAGFATPSGLSFDTAGSQNELLDSLFGDAGEDTEDSLLSLLQNLPSGSLLNTTA